MAAALVLVISSDAAFYPRSRNGDAFVSETRNDRQEILQDQQVRRDDRHDLNQDKEESHRDLRNGAGAGEIANDRSNIMEITSLKTTRVAHGTPRPASRFSHKTPPIR
jgi:hypothetical protein